MKRNYNKEIMVKTLNNIQTPHIVEKNWIVILFRKKIKNKCIQETYMVFPA